MVVNSHLMQDQNASCGMIIRREKVMGQTETIDIINYHPRYREDFKRLNLEWIQKLFCVEPIDHELLSNPEKYFLEPGGYIFFAKYCNQIVGTCALLKHQNLGFELSKLGVMKLYRGMKVGKTIVKVALETVKSRPSKTAHRPCPLFGPPCPSPKPSNLGHSNVI